MNKKLFSWKALAGLALLVAMGLTSCKQNTEVDPNDPYNTQKPAKPGTSEKGTADLTFTITKAVQLKELWDSYDQKKKAELMEKPTLNIDVIFKDFEIVPGETFVLQKYFNKVANSTLNISFKGNFKNADKQMLGVDIVSNLTGANVNIKLPAQTFSLNLNAGGVGKTTRPVLTSDGATLTTLTGSFPSEDKNILTIGNGVTVKVLDDVKEDVKVSGTGAIEAVKLTNGIWTGEDDGTIKKNGLKFTNLEIAGKVTICGKAGDKKLKLQNIHVVGKNLLMVGTWDAKNSKWLDDANVESIANINGDLDDKKNLQAEVYTNAIAGKLSKVKLGKLTVNTIEIKDGSALDNVEIMAPVKASANIGSVSGVIFGKTVTVNFDKSNVDFAFKGVKFAGGLANAIKVEGKVESEVVNTYETWKYSVATATWTKEPNDDPNVAINDKISKYDTTKGYFVDANDNKVVPEEDVVRFKNGSSTLTTLPENTSVTLDKTTVDTNKIDGSNVTSLFSGATAVNPGYKVILNDVTYVWKATADGTTTSYQLRKQ